MDNPRKVMILDDEKNITTVMQAMLEKSGYEALAYNDSALALRALEKESVCALVTDLYMPGVGGMEVLSHCQKNHPEIPVVVITAFGTVESAVSAIKQGAFDYITKPFDQSEFVNTVRKAVATYEERQKEPEIAASVIQGCRGVVGTSTQMQDVFKVVAKIADSPSTVLILGESGTGKELIALEIHRQSSRSGKPFIKINCAAIPATLIESELFGYEKGAFTGAVGSKPGRFELAHEGTLFLDEVAEMPLEMQVKLLRVLQEQEFERVGGVSTVHIDVRIITATNRDIETEVKAGRFREDLFYRLNVVPILLPALRDRKEDIDHLAKYFIAQFNEKLKKGVTGLSPECMQALRGFAWPGNIRQLENVMERMILMADHSVLTIRDLPDEVAQAAGISVEEKNKDEALGSFKEMVKKQTQSFERDLIEKALDETGGNVTKTAEKLGLSRKGLQLKIKELGLKRPGD